MNYDDIIQRFNIIKKYKTKCLCKCPVHQDDKASLTITYNSKDKKTLMMCQAGCNTSDILKSVELIMADLFDDTLKKEKIDSKNGFNNYDEIIQYLKENPINNDEITNIYKFRNYEGKILYLKLRTEDKKFLHVRLIDNKLVWGLKGGIYYETFKGSNIYSSNEKDTKSIEVIEQEKILYNLSNVIKGIKEDKTIYIVEGEKDANNLIKNGLIATTTSTGGGSGKEKWNNSYSEYFKAAKVVILPDNDESGLKFAEQIKQSLLNYCFKVQVLIVSNTLKGDISDWLEEGHSIMELYELLKEVKPIYARWYNVSKNGNITLNRNRLAHHLSLQWNYIVASNGLGNGIFHMYKDGAYMPIHRLEPYIRPYIYIDYKTPDSIRSIADGLRQIESVDFEELHGDENIINLKNGLYNIKTNELLAHNKKYISSTQLNCNYSDNPHNGGKWDKYIYDLTEGNKESILFLQEVAGVILSNIKGYRLKSIVGLQGKGDSGKTQFFNVLGSMLGDDLVGTASLQKLSNAQFIGSAIYGKRIVFDGDLPSDPLTNVDVIKKLSGGDKLSIEFKGINSFNYRFSGIIVFACNDMPYLGNDKGEHFYNRFNILQCNNVISKEEQNPFIADEIFDEEKEYVFLWALEGLKRVINNGYKFTETNVISNVRENVKNEQDSVRAFIVNNYDVTNDHEDKINFSDLFRKYELFCDIEGYNHCKRKSFRVKLLDFYKLKVTKPKNVETIHGLKIKLY
ncbi:phage/plasmid primase, P4 family [Clostridium botulinum]|uniref:phage/plasmid primase, P4 family n=1 Tax=Clostridium botulinum TaxID=1491 RepID=UPI0007743FA7|nr:phage/plasmid primase, P4 family [Clostridium botulinum]NFE96156.1 toprim domain-containing protein [Clostridium botulinum]NFL39639.1 toprim domain-containing protein [Clostridium botulinum]NFL67218.1 toprim domain-containing protein [Clostridium botulinum]NFN09527.1 toprim domain-containing protein [Clostridium botulinum]NFN26779.1 toprim domain-containing protein [Clostridium botulinum]